MKKKINSGKSAAKRNLDFEKRHEYDNIIEQANAFLADGSKYNDETEIISARQKHDMVCALMDIIKADMQSEYIASFLYTKEGKPVIPFLLEYRDENNNTCNTITNPEETVTVSLADTCVIASPWNIKRFVNSFLIIKEKGFRNYTDNHKAIYIENMDICFAKNGYHSITSGILHKKGEIQAQYIRLEQV